MKKQPPEIRKHFVKTRMNDKELQELRRLHTLSMDRHLSNYLRKVLLQKPVQIKYRNQSADDFLREMAKLKTQLTAISNNYNQAVEKLHILEKIPEFRSWIHVNEISQKAFIKKVEEIQFRINQLYEQWLQE